MKKIAILGSTGSIGVNTLEVVARFPDQFRVVGLSANENCGLLSQQIKRFQPKIACIMSDARAAALTKRTSRRAAKIVSGLDGLIEIVTRPDVDVVVMAIVGSISLVPLLKAITAGKQIALASKEALIAGGELIVREARRKKVSIIPVDSEHSAIFQCIDGRPRAQLKKIYLTGTGGPLRTLPRRVFDTLTREEVTSHPRWKMGKKISVDSATLMNKGLEVIEAHWLFSMPIGAIEVVIHPEAVVHSMVECIDGSIIAQLSVPDMRIPIQYALGYPRRLPQQFGLFVDFNKTDTLTFQRPDREKFPCLDLAFGAARDGGTFPAVLNASNEEAVCSFLDGKIPFTRIPTIVERVLAKHTGVISPDLDDILKADGWSREEARSLCCR